MTHPASRLLPLRPFTILAALLALCSATSPLPLFAADLAVPAATPPPVPAGALSPLTYYPVDQRADFSASLNGTWKFKLGAPEEDFTQPGFDDASWKPIQVPGNWELQGFEDPLYRKPGDAEGFYRRTFTVPAAWQGRRTYMRFEGVGYAFSFFIDGKRVGSFASSFNRSEFDITDFVQAGRAASLAVHVTRREKGWEFDTNDDWALSGIHRDVVIFSIPETHVKDYTVTTPVGGDGKQASVRVKAWLETFARQATEATLNAKVFDAQGAAVGSFSKTVQLAGADAAGVAEGEIPVAAPRLWTAETPHLYRLDLELVVAGRTVHQFTQRVGLRATTIEGGVFKLNGQPVKFRGINHHDMHPEGGRVMTREQYIQDIELMKTANINTVRTAHYPPRRMLLDLCDEYGMYVIDEVPFGFGEEHLTDESYADVLALRARATVARDKNSTSVLIWTIGNENPYTPLVVRTAGIVKELDPSRSRCIAHPGGKYYFQPPEEIDVLAPHYLQPRISPHATKGNRPGLEDIITRNDIAAPVLITEYAHAAGTGMEFLKDSWEVMESSDRFIGGCIWEFQDQGIYRAVPAGTYPGLPKMVDAGPVLIGKVKANTWVGVDRVIDTGGQEGADGIVDAERIPTSDYWAVQKIYSTVIIPIDSLPAKAGHQTLVIPFKNRYDYTDLASVTVAWELRIDGQRTEGGTLQLQAAPRQSTTAQISINLPETPAAHDQFLRFTITDAKGRETYQHTVRLLPENTPTPVNVFKDRIAGGPAGALKRAEQGPVVSYAAGDLRLQVNKDTGEVKFGAKDRPALGFDNIALRVGRTPQMSELRAYGANGSGFWFPYLLTQPVVKAVTAGAPANGLAKIALTLEFTRLAAADAPGKVGDQKVLADIHLTLSEQGWLDVDYELRTVNATQHLLEVGLAFQLSKTATRLTWLGKGPYPVYPMQSEGMERGVYTVAPKPPFDTANRAYAGNRTEVDVASATDEEGNGLGAVCQSGTVSLEPEGEAAFFSHLARVAGHGEKRSYTVASVLARDVQNVAGSIRLVPLAAGEWSEPFKTVLGHPEVSQRIVASPPLE